MREAYKGTSSIENGGRKSPIKIEIRKDFYLITVSFTILFVFETFFIIFRPFSVLPNVTAPFVLSASQLVKASKGISLRFQDVYHVSKNRNVGIRGWMK